LVDNAAVWAYTVKTVNNKEREMNELEKTQEQLITELGRMAEYLAVAADDGAYDQEISRALDQVLALIAQAQGLTK
jgi:hypothetical protein